MRYLYTFETYTSASITRGAEIQMEREHENGSLMDKTIDKELTQEEMEELEEKDEEEMKKRKKRIPKKVVD